MSMYILHTRIEVGLPIAHKLTKRSCPPVTSTRPDFGPILRQFVLLSWHAKLAIFCDLTLIAECMIYFEINDRIDSANKKLSSG